MSNNLREHPKSGVFSEVTTPGGVCASETEATPSTRRAISDSVILDFLILVLGFGLCRAWIIFCLGAPLVAPTALPNHWMYLASGAAAALAIAWVCWRDATRAQTTRALLFKITPIVLAASGLLLLGALATASVLLMVASFVIGGLGAGALQVLWGERFAFHSVQFAAFASPAAAIVTAAVVALSSSQATFMEFIAIPLLSLALLLFHASRSGQSWHALFGGQTSPEESDAGTDAPSSSARPDSHAARQASAPSAVPLGVGKLMFSIMIFSLLCRMFDSVPGGSDPLAALGGSAVFSLVVVGVAFLAIMTKVRKHFNPSIMYRLSLPIMVTGYVAIALFFDTHAFASVLIINIGYEFFDILTWVLFVDAAHRHGENALRIFGLGVAFMFCGMALGNLAGYLVGSLITAGSVQTNVVAMAAILGLVIVAFLVLPEGTVAQFSSTRRESRREQEDSKSPGESADETADEPSPEGRIETHCTAVTRDFGLTPRESEVVVLLAYGRTLAIIARDLHIAQGTARTHIENIYRKLDVHKQQELIDLVDSYGDEGSTRNLKS